MTQSRFFFVPTPQRRISLLTWLARLPILRTYAAVRAQAAQLATVKAEVRQLRERAAEIPKLRKQLEDAERRLNALHASVVTPRTLKQVLKGGGQHYREATPFPHIVIDNFLDGELLTRVADEFAKRDRTGWRRTANAHERKLSTADETTFGPFTRRVFAALNSSPFVTFLEELTGITGLIADPHLRGGGLHEIERGGLLGVHADFNHYERLNIWRRLNLLVYLNSTWDEGWGGHLELWDRSRKACVKRIAPAFNRAVIFDTSNFSYHGHPHPLNSPEGQSRRSLALYYYTVDYSYADDRTPHSTVFLAEAA